MALSYIENQTFNKISQLEKAEYTDCIFENCQLANTNLSDYKFIDCEFINCDLSNTNLNKTSLRNVHFKDCKMIGILFDRCHTFSLSFSFNNCLLNHSSFYELKLKQTKFNNCRMHDCDLSNADFSDASFINCDFLNAQFDRTVLIGADFTSAHNYCIHPEKNQIRNAKFSLSGVSGLLYPYEIYIENH